MSTCAERGGRRSEVKFGAVGRAIEGFRRGRFQVTRCSRGRGGGAKRFMNSGARVPSNHEKFGRSAPRVAR